MFIVLFDHRRDGVNLVIHDWPQQRRIPVEGRNSAHSAIRIAPAPADGWMRWIRSLEALASSAQPGAEDREVLQWIPRLRHNLSSLGTWGGARQKVDAMTPSSRSVIMRSSLGRRASRSLARFLIVFFIGVVPLWVGSHTAVPPGR